ncbi:hypothetical protein LR48_Vigan03g268000 [Vigna angularis]|uniref:mannan endo-1,4-beta-mannosidase n=1 Tax=Phaseolus angularis TaxID=3914 RepID=A0A0L9U950_PHAAN|nr:hypothetical protein LR48_Vigan03g268000 [Vigna angularis]
MGFQNLVWMSFMMILCISLYVNCIDIAEKRIVAQRPNDFIERNGTHFFLNGKPHYFNGFNAYWLMTFAADPSTSSKVTTAFEQASQHGLNLARTMAFNDGGYRALQISPGVYNENVFRDWVSEMAAYVKSIDNKHLLQVGLEGFYGNSMPERGLINPDGYHVGTDFISNNLVPEIDYASIHAYPDEWMARFNQSHQDVFTERWVSTHIQDAQNVLRKPILVTEFGLNAAFRGFTNAIRDRLYAKFYKWVYGSASQRGPCAGAAFWQLFFEGMENMADGYDIIFQRNPSIVKIIAQQSLRMSRIL